jgi:Fe-S-cluster-containing dehydrogenase component
MKAFVIDVDKCRGCYCCQIGCRMSTVETVGCLMLCLSQTQDIFG